MAATLITTLASIAVGALVTWCVAKWYYDKATLDLRSEIRRLESLVNLITRGMEQEGGPRFARGAREIATGLHHSLSGSSHGTSASEASIDVGQVPDNVVPILRPEPAVKDEKILGRDDSNPTL